MVRSTTHTSPSSPGSSTTKRRKVEDEDTNGIDASNSKKQRTRVSFSCGECHRRKQKCDRQVPCSHCVARKVPELCKAYTPGKVDQDLNARLLRLEQIIEVALPQYCSPGTPKASSFEIDTSLERRRSTSILDDDNRSLTEEQEPSGGTFQSGKWYGNSASGSVAPASVLEQLQNAVMPTTGKNAQDRNHLSPLDSKKFDQSLGQRDSTTGIDSAEQSSEPSAADNLKSLVQECGVSPHKISELLQELPSLRSSDVLIEYYFTSINWTRYPVSESDFRKAYRAICAHGSDGVAATNPNDVGFLPLLFVVLAISVRLAPEHIAGDARNRRVTSLRYYWSSRRSLLIAAAIQPDSLNIVLTRLLSARFLTFDRRITECWSQLGAAVRTAQALGLHRDGSTMGMDPASVEYRRRIWSYLYHADRSYALVLGRPNSIQDDYTSTKPPLNIDDELWVTQIQKPPPLSSPTPMTFVILRHQLAAIIGRMVHHFQQLRTTSHYSEVLVLDDELLKFVANLPPHFSLEPDTSFDEVSKFIPVHRFLLITEILFVRIGLHRPYLLRRLSSDRYSRSRTACFESAMKDFQVRQAFRESMPKETRDALSNAYREFQTAMISGIYLVLDPKGKYAPAMHAILDGFMTDHEGVREVDETTRRELKTIEFLKNKASQMECRGEISGGSHSSTVTIDSASNSNGTEHPAHLLLGLHQSVSLSPPLQTSFPSLVSRDNRSGSTLTPHASPPLAYSRTAHVTGSPTFNRIQQSSPADYVHSPVGSGSPTAEDDSEAQSLLDHWCNTVSNGPPIDSTAGAMSWGGPAGADISGWVGTAPSVSGGHSSLLTGLDGSDWNYWEALVNQIHRAP